MKKVLYLLAGGKSNRFGTDKLMMPIGVDVVFSYILKKVTSYHIFDMTVVVCDEAKSKRLKLEGVTDIYIAEPGDIRYASVLSAYNTLSIENDDIVLVHDAARPLAAKALFEKVIAGTLEKGNCFPALKISDTIRYIDEERTETLDRDKLYLIQTPQGFRGEILKKILQYNIEMDNITDEGVILERLGIRINTVNGDAMNFKITFLADYKNLVELLK